MRDDVVCPDPVHRMFSNAIWAAENSTAPVNALTEKAIRGDFEAQLNLGCNYAAG